MATGCSQIVAGKDAAPSVDAAHAVDGYLLDEELIHVDNVFLLPFSGVDSHFLKTFLVKPGMLFLSNIEICPSIRNSLNGQCSLANRPGA